MSKNLLINEKNYNGVSVVEIPTQDGGKAQFKDVDDIETLGYTKTLLATAVASQSTVSNGQLIFENVEPIEAFKIVMIEANPTELTSGHQRMMVFLSNGATGYGIRYNALNNDGESSVSSSQLNYNVTEKNYTINGAGASSKLADGVTYKLYVVDIDVRNFTEFDTF